MIDAAQRRLESLTATNPLVLELAGADDVEARWQELDLATQRRVISLIVEPRPPRRQGLGGTQGRPEGPRRMDVAVEAACRQRPLLFARRCVAVRPV